MPLLRLLLLLACFLIAAVLIAAHGLRGLALAAVLLVAVTLLTSRGWRRVEERLSRVTGSRRRTYGGIMFLFIALALGYTIYGVLVSSSRPTAPSPRCEVIRHCPK